MTPRRRPSVRYPAWTFPLAPLLALDERRNDHPLATVANVARVLQIARRNAKKYADAGMIPWHLADKAAVRLGHHPCEIWPAEWAALIAADLGADEEHPDQGEQAA